MAEREEGPVSLIFREREELKPMILIVLKLLGTDSSHEPSIISQIRTTTGFIRLSFLFHS